jgi:hypothetical protein
MFSLPPLKQKTREKPNGQLRKLNSNKKLRKHDGKQKQSTARAQSSTKHFPSHCPSKERLK